MNSMRERGRWTAAEFFAGIGLAGLGLREAGIEVTWSNDIARGKYEMFERRFGVSDHHSYIVEDLGKLSPHQLPENIDVAWGSFPCTDLSVAGGRAGLHRGAASSTFWHFIKAISKMNPRPPIIALENVTAFATSNSGRDLVGAIKSLNGLGYSVDVLSVDARHFLPQSRPRLFLIGLIEPGESLPYSGSLRPAWLEHIFADRDLRTHQMGLPDIPGLLSDGLVDYVDALGESDSRWWSSERVARLVESLSELQFARMVQLRDGPGSTFRTAYRRMRAGVPRWEIRSDGLAGCLRTASGGSSKQALVILGDGRLKVRWMSPGEYARLMGAPNYPIDGVSDNQAYSGFGDAVCVPVVEWLARNYLAPVLERSAAASSLSQLEQSGTAVIDDFEAPFEPDAPSALQLTAG